MRVFEEIKVIEFGVIGDFERVVVDDDRVRQLGPENVVFFVNDH